jgi:hypothetical protein
MTHDTTLQRMQSLLQQWKPAADPRAIFLDCYYLMTCNMRAAARQGEFFDPLWVDGLVDHFATYYFVALEAYDRDPASAPRVWQQAHRLAGDPRSTALQKLLIGVNAHINYDLVFSTADMLQPEWRDLPPERRAARYADYRRVNEIIARTVDAVQDQVLEPAMPVMDLIDRLCGPLDEKLISALLARWRENVWRYTLQLLETAQAERQRLAQTVEQEALATGKLICPWRVTDEI